jgi:hypothetical protein
MVIIPKDRPLIQNLNSYYLNIQRMLEHYQGEVGSGAIHFKSSSTEGVIFFDREEFLDGICENKEERFTGRDAVEFLTKSSSDVNYTISLYVMEPDKVYFWSSIPNARRIYEDLSTDFTDLDGLMRKMSTEKLTGYIEVSLDKNMEGALIFYSNGQIIGGSYSWDRGEFTGSKENLTLLAEKAKTSGGKFHVSRVSLTKGKEEAPRAVADAPSPAAITAVEELLGLLERVVGSSRAARGDFYTLLKKRFLAQAETYEFLDPFSGEFQYSNRKVKFSGRATDEQMMKAVLTAVRGLAEELGLTPEFQAQSAGWFQKYHGKLASFGIMR